MDSFISNLNVYFGQKAPALPAGFKQFLVKAAPWLIIIGALAMAPAAISFLSFNFSYPGAAMFRQTSLIFWFSIAALVLELIALPGLLKRQRAGWTFLFYALLVNTVGSLLGYDLASAVIGFIIGAYLLFQVKNYYM